MTAALGEKLIRFHDGRTQRETDRTAVKAGKAAPVAASFIFKQADHVAYWHETVIAVQPRMSVVGGGAENMCSARVFRLLTGNRTRFIKD
jgi:hypothetical protein